MPLINVSEQKLRGTVPVKKRKHFSLSSAIVLGIADIQLKLGGVCFCQTAIVCDTLPDGIHRQDFML